VDGRAARSLQRVLSGGSIVHQHTKPAVSKAARSSGLQQLNDQLVIGPGQLGLASTSLLLAQFKARHWQWMALGGVGPERPTGVGLGARSARLGSPAARAPQAAFGGCTRGCAG